MNATFSTLVQLLQWRAQQHPEQRVYTYLSNGSVEGGHLTYAELDRLARDLGARLQQMGITGERAILLYPSGLEYMVAFWGCLYAGAIAVPAYPPRNNRNLQRLQSMLFDGKPAIILTTEAIRNRVEAHAALLPGFEAMRWTSTDILRLDRSAEWKEPDIDRETIAFLQYTSGSTSMPKGVMVSHGNLLHNFSMMEAAYGHSEETVIVNWLPLFHDMGLIGNVLQTVYSGCTCILMSSNDFLQKPIRWLEAISRYKATFSGGPNFAYELCARKIKPEQLETLDLSCWKGAYNGAEPVRADTMHRFLDKFAACGFQPNALTGAYGLAEATLFVAGAPGEPHKSLLVDSEALKHNQVILSDDGAGAVYLIGCNQVGFGQKILIVNPDTHLESPPGEVGEIWVQGPSVAAGYFNRDDATESTFRARLADTGEGSFLRTGDLGFLEDGDLYVTGRLKDLVVIYGQNHYPQDIEHTVEKCAPMLAAGYVGAFAVDVGGEERLVIVAEVERTFRNEADELNRREIMRIIRKAVSEIHQVRVHDLVLLEPGKIPMTSSGKIRRAACKEGYESGTLDVWEWKNDGVVYES